MPAGPDTAAPATIGLIAATDPFVSQIALRTPGTARIGPMLVTGLLGANNTPFLSLLALFLVDPRQELGWDGWYVFGVDDVINEIETGS